MKFYIATYKFRITSSGTYAIKFESLSDLNKVFDQIRKVYLGRKKEVNRADIEYVDIFSCTVNVGDFDGVKIDPVDSSFSNPVSNFGFTFSDKCHKYMYRYDWDWKTDTFHVLSDGTK